MFLNGFRFGLLLQFAVGPICLMVFNTAGNDGFFRGALAAMAVTMVDGLYIFLAATGASAFLRKDRVKEIVRFVGAGVLILFGLNIAARALGTSILPQVTLFGSSGAENAFLKAALMTASNPLTIVFWGGVFSARVASGEMSGSQLFLFGTGCVSSTFVFLNIVAGLGSVVNNFLPPVVMAFLNICVGAVIIFFALKMAGLVKFTKV